ncbi:MAG: DUF1993 domain-containing protein [Pseudomonadota bacterium]
MNLSFYELSVGSYLQVLGGVAQTMNKGRALADEGQLDLDQLVRMKLRDDMLPFSFQIISAWHHSLGCIKGLKAGLFEPPPRMQDMDYEKLTGLVNEAIEGLRAESPETINALEDKSMTFRVGSREIPFKGVNFVCSFSLPNFYFHATTAYDMLRMQGVPLGKMDYLGRLRTGVENG